MPWIYFVIVFDLQHLLLFVKVMLAFLIPDAPAWVETVLAREDYQSKQALKKQVSVYVLNEECRMIEKYLHGFVACCQCVS